MSTKKLWLLAVPMAVIAIQGCGGGNGGLTTPTPTPNPTATPTPVANNIGRYTNVTPTNGQNNLDSTNFVLNARGVSSNSRIDILQQNRAANDMVANERAFSISTSQLSAGGGSMQPDAPDFVEGRTYSLVDGIAMGDNRAYAVYSQTVPDASAPTGFRNRLWRAVSGSLVITEAPRNSSGDFGVMGFRVVNARFEPAFPLLGAESAKPELAQGSFTFDINSTTGPVSQ